MKEKILSVSYRAGLEEKGRKTMQDLSLQAEAGESIFLNGNVARRQLHFEILAGQRMPDKGAVILEEWSLYENKNLPVCRREKIGVIPSLGGLIPELTILEQIILPMQLSGWSRETMIERVKSLTGEHLPLHDLYNRPNRCSQRKQAIASILRALVMNPKLILMNGFLDDYQKLDADILWSVISQYRSPESILIYLSGAPASQQVSWTQEIKL